MSIKTKVVNEITVEDIKKFVEMDMPSANAGKCLLEIVNFFALSSDFDNNTLLSFLDSQKAFIEKIVNEGGDGLKEKFVDENDTKVTNHPKRYLGKSGVEAIDIIEFVSQNIPGDLAFNIGTAVKYLSRLGKKKTTDEVEDWKKTLWYINRAIKLIEE